MIVIDGKEHSLPGVEVLSWKNSTLVQQHTKVSRREKACRLIVVHTVHGYKCKSVKAGGKPSTRDLMWYRSHYRSTRRASTDAYVDTDGSIVWSNDPAINYTWGAGAVNGVAMHIEMVTDSDGQLYEKTIESTGKLIELCCKELGIQMQTPWDHGTDSAFAGRIPLCDPRDGGKKVVGVIGHRNIWSHPKFVNAEGQKVIDYSRHIPTRGFGDPNDFIFQHLVSHHKFEPLSYVSSAIGSVPECHKVWMERQLALRVEADGVPLMETLSALAAQGVPHGLWALRQP